MRAALRRARYPALGKHRSLPGDLPAESASAPAGERAQPQPACSPDAGLRTVFLGIEDNRTADGGTRLRDFELSRTIAAISGTDIFAFKQTAAPSLRHLPHPGQFHVTSPRRRVLALLRSIATRVMFHEARFDYSLHDPALGAALKRADLIVMSMPYSARYLKSRSALIQGARVIWDTQNFDPDVWQSKAELSSGPRRWIMKRQEAKLPRLLQTAYELADVVIACTERDRVLIREYFGGEKCVVVVENATDVDRFSKVRDIEPDRHTIAIVGTLNHDTNLGGLVWFLSSVWPEVLKREPRARLIVAGRYAPESLKRTINETTNAALVESPTDILPIYEQACVIAVPQLYGTGSKLKMFEAIATGRSIVASPAALVGIPQSLTSTIAMAESGDAWGSAIVSALHDSTTPTGDKTLPELDAIDWSRSRKILVSTIENLFA